MDLTEDRPFLSETQCDLTRAVGKIDWHVQYVLHNARLLIVGFFDEERVVLDSFGERLGGDRRSYHHQKTSEANKDAQFRSSAKSREQRKFHR